MNIPVLCTNSAFQLVNEQLSVLIESVNLPLTLTWHLLETLNNKEIKQFFAKKRDDKIHNDGLVFIAEVNKDALVNCTLCTLTRDGKNKPIMTKVSLDWHKLQRRIVTAGRKSELLLQACKLTPDSLVLDATAGFGHDSLILASTLANQPARVTMMEQNPVMALLLMLERVRMSEEPNWQRLMNRLEIRFGNVMTAELTQYDVVYLDPMFPNESYQGAKVGKGMQVLHTLANPPTMDEENQLLQTALSIIKDNGRVIVKRPKNAPFLANINPDESWSNDVVRFDGYFG